MEHAIEIWKPINNFTDWYEVSNLGNIRSLDRYINTGKTKIGKRKAVGKVLKNKLGTNGYLFVCLSKNQYREYRMIHRIVAEQFIPNPFNLEEVNHIDGNKLNNTEWNLERCTREENISHSYRIGIRKPTILTREQCHLSKLTQEQVNQCIELRLKGVFVKNIAEMYKMSVSGLEKLFSKNNIYISKQFKPVDHHE